MADLERDLRALVDASPTIDADEVRYRSRRRSGAHASPRRPLALALAALVVTAVLVTGIALLRSGGSDNGSVVVPIQPSPTPAPDEIVTIAEDGRVVVLNGAGESRRLLTGSADTRPGQVSVAPDGTIYFLNAALETIVEIPSAGGVARNVIEPGCCIQVPSASPDGRWLAYSGVPNQSDAGRDILLQSRTSTDRGTGGVTYARRWSGRSTLAEGIEILGWTPDASGVVFVDLDEADPRPQVLDIATPQSESLDDQPLLELPPDLAFAAYRGTADRMVLLDRTGEPARVVAWDRSSGNVETLFTLEGVRMVTADPSGDHLLAVADSGLYRWSTGDPDLTRITGPDDGIVAAAWLPATTATPAPTATATVPTTATTGPAATAPTMTGATDRPPNTTADGKPLVQVLNGSAVQGDATRRSNDLKTKAWAVLPPGNAPGLRDGTAIQCVDGFGSAAARLRTDLQSFGVDATIEALEDPLPLGYDTAAACYVILGR